MVDNQALSDRWLPSADANGYVQAFVLKRTRVSEIFWPDYVIMFSHGKELRL